jgi:hypothetical protein
MNEDYLDLDFNLPQLLLVACVNEYDPTRMHRSDRTNDSDDKDNTWLRGLCDGMDTIDKIVDAEMAYATFVKAIGHPGLPVDPVSQANKSTTAAPPDDSVLAAQKALKASGCDPRLLDGKEGPDTDAAAACYQKAHKLKQTGVLDADTLLALKVITGAQ